MGREECVCVGAHESYVPRRLNQAGKQGPTNRTMSSPSIRRDTPASPRLSLQQIAERSQRQLIVTAVLGTLCTLLIVLMFILFHEVVPLGVDSVTGSSVIETEQHIRHMFAMGHHKDALDHLNALIQEKPLHRWEQHLDLMADLLRKSNLKTTTTTAAVKTDSSPSSSLQDDDDDPVDAEARAVAAAAAAAAGSVSVALPVLVT